MQIPLRRNWFGLRNRLKATEYHMMYSGYLTFWDRLLLSLFIRKAR